MTIQEVLHTRLVQIRVLRRVGPAPAWFYIRARRLARRRGDAWALQEGLLLSNLAVLLELAGRRRQIVEIGTSAGWTAIALALADPDRQVVSYDLVARPARQAYLDLVGESARSRVTFVEGPGELAAYDGPPVALLFIDASHQRDDTIATFEHWRPRLAPSAIVVFDDFGNPRYPGVREAVEDLALDGRTVGDGLFVWRNAGKAELQEERPPT